MHVPCPAPGKKLEAVESQVSTSGRLGRFLTAGSKKGERWSAVQAGFVVRLQPISAAQVWDAGGS